jgi:HEAT repeat protein
MGNKIRALLALLLTVALSLTAVWAAEDKVAFLSDKLGKNPSFKVRLKAAVLLGRMKDPRAVRPLCDALEDDNYVVRGAAARALGNLGHPMAVAAVEPLLRMVGDEELFVRKEVRRALENLSGKKSIDYFISALSHDDSAVRLTAVHVLSMMRVSEARMAVIPALGDSDEEVRAEAIVAVKGLGHAEMESLLTQAISKKDNYRVQVTAARLIGEMRINSAMGSLADLLVQDDVVPEVKREAAETLSLIKDQINVSALIAQLSQEDRILMDRAIKLLGIHDGREAVDALLGLLKHPDPFVRRKAVFALSDTDDPRATPALEFLLKSEDNPRFRELIKRTLRKLRP